MDSQDVDSFEKLVSQLQSVYDEVALLAKKVPNDAINLFKLGFINSLIEQANELLGKSYRPFDTFIGFDQDDLPSNSDAVFILGQYLGCFEKLRADNVIQGFDGRWQWRVRGAKGQKTDEDGFVYIDTVKPKRLRE